MKRPRTTLRARFDPETRYDVAPVPVVPFRGTRETELEQLKQRLLRETLGVTGDTEMYAPLRRAANEAAAVAWITSFPLLFFPTLFEEKVTLVRAQFVQQQKVRYRSRRLVEVIG